MTIESHSTKRATPTTVHGASERANQQIVIEEQRQKVHGHEIWHLVPMGKACKTAPAV